MRAREAVAGRSSARKEERPVGIDAQRWIAKTPSHSPPGWRASRIVVTPPGRQRRIHRSSGRAALVRKRCITELQRDLDDIVLRQHGWAPPPMVASDVPADVDDEAGAAPPAPSLALDVRDVVALRQRADPQRDLQGRRGIVGPLRRAPVRAPKSAPCTSRGGAPRRRRGPSAKRRRGVCGARLHGVSLDNTVAGRHLPATQFRDRRFGGTAKSAGGFGFAWSVPWTLAARSVVSRRSCFAARRCIGPPTAPSPTARRAVGAMAGESKPPDSFDSGVRGPIKVRVLRGMSKPLLSAAASVRAGCSLHLGPHGYWAKSSRGEKFVVRAAGAVFVLPVGRRESCLDLAYVAARRGGMKRDASAH